MKDNAELQPDDDWPEDDIDLSEKGRARSGGGKFVPVLVGVLIVVVLAAGVYYLTSRRSSGSDANLMQMKMAAFEQKISDLERQIADLRGKPGPGSVAPDPALLQRVESLANKVEALEKRPQPKVEATEKRPQSPAIKEATPASHKPPVESDKRYHTVRKGETLYKVSKAYGISVETLRKLNNLSADQGLRTGQKLLVSSGR